MLTLTFAAAVAWASLGQAQDTPKPKDDAVDKLLEKLEAPKSSDADKKEPATVDKKPDDKKPDDKKPKDADAGAPAPKAEKPAAGPAEKGKGEVDSRDQAIDDLLGKLGETRDVPSKDDRPKAGGGKPGDEPMPPKPGPDKSKADEPTGKAKDLDEHLEELTGRRKKKKDSDQDGEGSGPLGEVVKKMREVEKRLDKTDTGEQTRQKQTEIVKNLEKIIEQIRSTSGQPKGKKKIQLAVKPGQQPGPKQGNQPGAVGAPDQKPSKPTEKRALVNGKDEWGHLPDALRLELENVSKEAPLAAKEELIRRYYLSVSKKSLSREE
jgi:hypothetical protein